MSAQIPAMPGGANDPRAQLLAQLHDVITPVAKGWWPPAPGWWILTALLVFIVVYSSHLLLRHYRNNRYRKQSLSALADIGSQTLEPSEKCKQIFYLLKRIFFTAYPDSRLKIAGVFGRQWIQLMNATLNNSALKNIALKQAGGDSDLEDAIEVLLYQAKPNQSKLNPNNHDASSSEHIEKLMQFSRHWIKHHQPRARLKSLPWQHIDGASHA